jgi:hypothetical protein
MKNETLKVIVYNSSTIEQSAKLFGHNKFIFNVNFGSDAGIIYRTYFNNRQVPYIESILTTSHEPRIIKNMQVISNIPNHKYFVLAITYFKRLLQRPPVNHKILSVVEIIKSKNETLDGNTHFELLLPAKKSLVLIFEV